MTSPRDWQNLRVFILTEIEAARTALEAVQPEAATAMLRGRVQAYRDLLSHAEPDPVVPTTEPTYS